MTDLIKQQFDRERTTLSPYAALSQNTSGRDRPEPPCTMRTDYARDRDRILHSKAFRRLMHKTQVFLSPEGDHYRTRLTHTLEVVQIARTIARALSLNEDLTEAIGLGHDLGHTPFGHAGEGVLDELYQNGFKHNEQSVRVVEVLEGLNLTREVRDGILCHTGERQASTLEGQVVRFADKIAYINHDIDDAVRAGVLRSSDIPAHLTDTLGKSSSERITSMARAVIEASDGRPVVSMTPDVYEAMMEMRDFLFAAVYRNPAAKGEEGKAMQILRWLYLHYVKNYVDMPQEYTKNIERDGIDRVVCDYLAGMTDRYAINVYTSIYIPKSWGR
ncbi:MAG: deoxyguanosinetriphosphate triphosphohydrolase [Eubacteriales bacterium]